MIEILFSERHHDPQRVIMRESILIAHRNGGNHRNGDRLDNRRVNVRLATPHRSPVIVEDNETTPPVYGCPLVWSTRGGSRE